MKNPLIHIPTPCRENWLEMTTEEKGRFCNACQKTVYDFTKSSDKMILEKFHSEKNICGRFATSQLDRELVIPKQRSTIWTAGIAGVLSLLNLSNEKLYAQNKPETVQNNNNTYAKMGEVVAVDMLRTISGTVYDDFGLQMPSATVRIKGTSIVTQTDFDGNFTIKAKTNDVIIFSFVGYNDAEKMVSQDNNMGKIALDAVGQGQTAMYVGGAVLSKRRTFFGRIFHKIGNIFQ